MTSANRLAIGLCLALAFWVYSQQVKRGGGPVIPAVIPGRPIVDLGSAAATLSSTDRKALSDAYAIMARAVKASPADDPVFATTGCIRDCHRAGLLCVWRGVLGNAAGKYPGLRETLEGLLDQQIGKDDVLLNPAIQGQVVTLFENISQSLR